jgi:6-phosphogluconolactonase
MEAVVNPDVRQQVRVFQNLESLSRGAAEFVATCSKEAIIARGVFSIAISGGTTPRGLYMLLGSSPWREAIDWKRVHVFWADERCVPADHRESNFKLANDAFIVKTAMPDEHIHRIEGEIGPAQAAMKYEQNLRAFFQVASCPVFDLILLGLGEDGHTASLFPGNAAVQEQGRLAAPVQLAHPRLDRVTLTLPVLNHAAEILFLVSGGAKAGVVRAIVQEKHAEHYPAGRVRPAEGRVTWFLDTEAATGLSGMNSAASECAESKN